MKTRRFDPGEITFVAMTYEDHTNSYLEATLKAAQDRKRRYGPSYKVLDDAIDRLKTALQIRRLEQHL